MRIKWKNVATQPRGREAKEGGKQGGREGGRTRHVTALTPGYWCNTLAARLARTDHGPWATKEGKASRLEFLMASPAQCKKRINRKTLLTEWK